MVATLEVLAEVGYEMLTIEAVAARAGVGRPTVYRRFPSKRDLVAHIFTAALGEVNPTPPHTGDANADLRVLLANTAHALSKTAFGMAVTEAVAPATRDRALMALFDGGDTRRAIFRSVMRHAQREGRLLATDIDVAIELALGALYFRHLINHRPLSTAFTIAVADSVIAPSGVQS